MIIWQVLRENILELSVDRAAHIENVILKETLGNKQFMTHLEGAIKDALRSGPKT